MIQLGAQTKLSPKVFWYRSVGALVFVIILDAILNFVAALGTVNGTMNGQPMTLHLGSMGPLVTSGIPLVLLLLNVLYNLLYYKMYSFVVDTGKISVTSGVVFPSTKTTDFRMVQNVATQRGPLLMMFGLQMVQGFTSSPGQLVISSGKNGTSTTYRPDISIPLVSEDAEQLRGLIAQSAEVPSVKVVQ